MPYKQTKDLPEQVRSLPLKAKKMFLQAFNSSYSKYGEEKAFKIAWSAVKRAYKKVDSKWVIKKTVNINTVIGKTGFFNPQYYFDAIISSNDRDLDGQEISEFLLQDLVNKNLIDDSGDIEHLSLFGDNRYKGVYKLINAKYDNGKLMGRFYIDKSHPKSKEVMLLAKSNKLMGVSAEFINGRVDGNKIVGCDRLGWTFTNNPSNPNARIAG